MRVVHIVCVYPPYKSGMGQVVFEMVGALRTRGHEVVVVTPQYKKQFPPDKTVIRLRPLFAYGNAAILPGLLKTFRGADLIHLHYPFFGTQEIVTWLRNFFPHLPVVVNFHMDPVNKGFMGFLFALGKWLTLPLLLRQADAWIASTFDYARNTSVGTHLARFSYKWHEIPFGVDSRRFSIRPKKKELLERYGLHAYAKTILFVGGMDEAHAFKGIPVLLQAIALLKKRGERVQALFVGDGPCRNAYEKEAVALGVQDITHFAGYVSPEDLPYAYNLGDVLVLPSVTQGEAFGLVLLEAMASGVPVIVSDLPGLRTIARSGGGRVVPPGHADALARAIQDQLVLPQNEQDRQKIREEIITRYSWENVAKTLEGVYQKIVDNR